LDQATCDALSAQRLRHFGVREDESVAIASVRELAVRTALLQQKSPAFDVINDAFVTSHRLYLLVSAVSIVDI
jgi:hypothetical protein